MRCRRCDNEINGIREICPLCGDSVSVNKEIVKLNKNIPFADDCCYSKKAILAVTFTILRFVMFQEPSLGTLFGYLGLLLAIIAYIEISLNQDRVIGKSLALSAIFNFGIFYFIYSLFQQTNFFH